MSVGHWQAKEKSVIRYERAKHTAAKAFQFTIM